MKRSLILLASLFLLSSSAWSAGTLKVTTPNGGQKWTTGKSYAVKWNKGSAGKYVRIRLLKSGRHYRWITKKTPNDGRYVWKIPTSVVASSNYKIRIQPHGKSGYDNSDRSFSISKSRLIILGNNNAELTGKTIGAGLRTISVKTVPVFLNGKRVAKAYINSDNFWFIETNKVFRKSFYCFLSLENVAFYDSSKKLLAVSYLSYLSGSVGTYYDQSYTPTCLAAGENGIFHGIPTEDIYDDATKVTIGRFLGVKRGAKPAPLRVIPQSYRTSGFYKEAIVKVKNMKAKKTYLTSWTSYLLDGDGRPIDWEAAPELIDIKKRKTYEMKFGHGFAGTASGLRIFLNFKPGSSIAPASTNNSCTGPKEKKLKCLKDASDDRNAQMEKRLIQQRGRIEKVDLNWMFEE